MTGHADAVVGPVVEREVGRDERVLWSGRPDRGRWFMPVDLLLVPFSLFWCGFVVLWEAVALAAVGAKGAGVVGYLFPLFGLPFVIVGLYLVFGRLLVRRWIRNRTFYALTDKRAICVAPSLPGGGSVTSVWLAGFPPVDARVGSDGYGSISIGSFPVAQRWLAAGAGWPGAGMLTGNAVVFSGICDAADVSVLLRQRLGELAPAATAAASGA